MRKSAMERCKQRNGDGKGQERLRLIILNSMRGQRKRCQGKNFKKIRPDSMMELSQKSVTKR